MRTTVRPLVGRDQQLETIDRLLDGIEQLPAAVLLTGEAGIGKTSVWLAGLHAATERGYALLSSRPAESEARFSYAGLHDLLGETADHALAGLPAVQRRALEAALLLREPGTGTDERVVAVALLGALRRLAADRPLCIAVDDLQWLDAASVVALRFALSRLEAEPVVALLATRGAAPSWLRRTIPEGRLQTVEIGGLSVGAVQELIRARLDASFPRPTLIRIWDTSRGNPLFALELAGALQRRGGTLALGEELPISSDLDELLHARIDGLGAEALEVVRVVAALAEATVSAVEAATGATSQSGLEEALAARIVELDGDRIRFVHPLLGSTVTAHELPASRRAVHAKLAEVAATTEERARHLALATTDPDREIAGALEAAAAEALDRGAPGAAAELAEQALRLTPPLDAGDARRRAFLAADGYRVAGDPDRAVAILQETLASDTAGVERAQTLVRLADIVMGAEPREAERLFSEALSEARGDLALEALIYVRFGDLMRWGSGLEAGLEYAKRAADAASRTDDVALRCETLAGLGEWLFRAGRGLQRELMEEALALERSLPSSPLSSGPAEHYCHQLAWAVEIDDARRLAMELLEARRRADDVSNEGRAHWNLAFLEWRAGNWDEAARQSARSLELRAELGTFAHAYTFPAAIVAAHQGRIDEARLLARQAVGRGQAAGVRIEQSGHGWILGFVELSLGDPSAALVHLRSAYEIRNVFMLEPAMRLELGDFLETLIALGELDEADEMLATWEPRARAVDRAWALANLARCRGLLLAARGDLDGAFASFENALLEHERSMDPFQHARTLLAFGRAQRRAKKRAASRSTLDDALGRFERLGAPLWAEQARGELARIGGRAPSGGELTEAEERIAHLVAEGGTNREVAAALFLTEHSVETALTRIYRKLGVRSRAELARTFTR